MIDDVITDFETNKGCNDTELRLLNAKLTFKN